MEVLKCKASQGPFVHPSPPPDASYGGSVCVEITKQYSSIMMLVIRQRMCVIPHTGRQDRWEKRGGEDHVSVCLRVYRRWN